MIELMPFSVECGIELLSSSPEEVRGRMQWSSELCTAGGIMHGGAAISWLEFLRIFRPSHQSSP